MAAIALGVVALGIAAALVLMAFEKNLVFFFTPSQVAANEAPQGRTFRIGGMVVAGSVKRSRRMRTQEGRWRRGSEAGPWRQRLLAP